mmetsp:Transcript_6559/g.11692  ORF Transcript_6559/g.11692 Transcript_6559/m.11692 type:complete len:94 (-) Transcript_6559:2592-2873(-)
MLLPVCFCCTIQSSSYDKLNLLILIHVPQSLPKFYSIMVHKVARGQKPFVITNPGTNEYSHQHPPKTTKAASDGTPYITPPKTYSPPDDLSTP